MTPSGSPCRGRRDTLQTLVTPSDSPCRGEERYLANPYDPLWLPL